MIERQKALRSKIREVVAEFLHSNNPTNSPDLRPRLLKEVGDVLFNASLDADNDRYACYEAD